MLSGRSRGRALREQLSERLVPVVRLHGRAHQAFVHALSPQAPLAFATPEITSPFPSAHFGTTLSGGRDAARICAC